MPVHAEELNMHVLRTPDSRFENLEDYPFVAHYLDVTARDTRPLRMHYLDEGPIDGPPICLLYTSPSPRDSQKSRMPSSA